MENTQQQSKTMSFSGMGKDEKAKVLNRLQETLKVLRLQADIQKAKADINEGRYKELAYAIKVDQIENPDRYNEKHPSNASEENTKEG